MAQTKKKELHLSLFRMFRIQILKKAENVENRKNCICPVTVHVGCYTVKRRYTVWDWVQIHTVYGEERFPPNMTFTDSFLIYSKNSIAIFLTVRGGQMHRAI
jgi:hypothetical protein